LANTEIFSHLLLTVTDVSPGLSQTVVVRGCRDRGCAAASPRSLPLTDPDVRISRIRLLGSRVRSENWHGVAGRPREREALQQLGEPSPVDLALGPAGQPLVPDAFHLVEEAHERRRVPGDAVVPVVPSELLLQGVLLDAKWLVAVAATPSGDTPEGAGEPVRSGSSLDGPFSPLGAAPVMREPEEIKTCRAALRSSDLDPARERIAGASCPGAA
jgi:hypothetical protein